MSCRFWHDASSATFKPYGDGRADMKTECYGCHAIVKSSDLVFTKYARR
jgi:hypothetical protein